MIRGLYIAASSAISEGKRVDTIANNIANVNTTGYKKDTIVTSSFPEILIAKIGGRFPDKDILKNNSQNGSMEVDSNGGVYKVSTKSGFFNVQTAMGVSRSKSIQFKVDESGNLVTPQGNYILGVNGIINTGGQAVTIDDKGQVMAGGTAIERLKVSNPINVIGCINSGVYANEVVTSFTQGQLYPTKNPLDLAIQGKGFFCIETPAGERYTRNGEFSKNAEGYLVTNEGFKVLGEKGYIKVEGSIASINEKGEVILDGSLVDKLKLIDFKDYNILRKEGDGALKVADGIDIEENAVTAQGTVNQGYIENSNVNSVREMVDMLTMLRSYEANQKLIKAHDEILGKSVNEVGKL